MTQLALSEARRIALAAQGFGRARPGRVMVRHVSATIRRLGLLQLDFVNVVAPAHYLTLYSRLGAYNRALLHTAAYQRREFIEHWAHVASLVPAEHWPLLRERRERHRVWPYGFENFLRDNPAYTAWVLEQVRERGPLAAEQLPGPPDGDRRLPGSWYGSAPRAVLEAHFGFGALSIAERRPDFARVYDLAARVVPAEHFAREMPHDEARRELLRVAARACGVATAADLADYYRMPVAEARPGLNQLADAGEIRPVQVEGWRQTAYLDAGAAIPARIDAAALLAPFDSLIWFRPRALRLFEFDYRFEIFVPQEKRRWGAYVLPFLLGERLVARVDAKADRAAGQLAVNRIYLEPHATRRAVEGPLEAELNGLAAWLELANGVRMRKAEAV